MMHESDHNQNFFFAVAVFVLVLGLLTIKYYLVPKAGNKIFLEFASEHETASTQIKEMPPTVNELLELLMLDNIYKRSFPNDVKIGNIIVTFEEVELDHFQEVPENTSARNPLKISFHQGKMSKNVLYCQFTENRFTFHLQNLNGWKNS